jgi:hypothetical protein
MAIFFLPRTCWGAIISSAERGGDLILNVTEVNKMVKYVKIGKNGTITLPRETLKAFPALSELVLWWKGDALVLKRVSPFLPAEFAKRVSKKELPLQEIVKEIHLLRKTKKRG